MALDALDLQDGFAGARQVQVAALEQDFEVDTLLLFARVGGGLADDLRERPAKVLCEIHADAALVDGEPHDGQRVQQPQQVGPSSSRPVAVTEAGCTASRTHAFA